MSKTSKWKIMHSPFPLDVQGTVLVASKVENIQLAGIKVSQNKILVISRLSFKILIEIK